MKLSPQARNVAILIVVVACAPKSQPAQDSAAQAGAATAAAATTAPPAERELFNGRDLTGWRGYKSPAVPDGWSAQNGVLTKSKGTGDILTADQFGDFDLSFDWKLSRGGNAGVFYRGTEEYDHIYWSAPEYQLLDDAHHPDGRSRLTSAGAAYALYPPPAGIVKPAGEWNSSRLLVQGNHVEHWLNGQKVVEYDLASPDWEAKVKASKFSAYPHYGRAARGYIGIQGDHDGVLSLRNIRIRELSR
ncbi:MAG TPA: DUF1080 domain-containing protein [Gemmatimonadaceae bacterium]|nr:DUF1080 domain-containing protein [Gemmatimonadaceae bacterium]